jgi:tetratricopeptide (TPR) repeat protein
MRSLRVILVAVLLAFAFSAVWGEKADKPRFHSSTYKMTAKIHLKGEYRMYDSAVAILEEGVQFFPDDAEMHFLLGKAYSHKKNYLGMAEQFALAESLNTKEKAKWLKELDEIRKEKWPQIFNQGVNYLNEQDYDTALDLFMTCTVLQPSDYRGFLRVGYAYALKGDNDNAISYMEKGIQLAPDDPDMLRGHADVMFFSGRGEEALVSYGKILESEPENVEILKNVATVHSAAKDYDQALEYLERAVEVDPTYKDGLFNIGEIYRQRLNQTIEGLDSLKDESGEYLKDQASAGRIEELLQEKKDYLSSAQGAYEKVMKIDTTDLEAMDRLSEVYQEQENFDQAVTLLETLVEKDSTNCKAWQQMAFIYAKRNLGEKANQAFQKAQDCVKAKQ